MLPKIEIPFELKLPAKRTDALCDLDIRICQALDLCGGILYLFGHASPEVFVPGQIRVKWRSLIGKKVPLAQVQVNKSDNLNLLRSLPERLFASGVIQLAAAFEAYLGDVLADVHFNNDSLLGANGKQLPASKVLAMESLEDVRQLLIEEEVAGYLSASYLSLVDRLERGLHVGLHSKKSPVKKREAHHFFEVRNIIVHHKGRASSQYLERLAPYAGDPPEAQLRKKGESFPVDFGWLFSQGRMLFDLASFLDKELSEKWTTTAALDGRPAMFWYGSSV